MLEFEADRGFGIYIHWPYCAKICPYCDFNVYAAKERDSKPLLDAISADLASWRTKTGPRRVDTIFFGGGTPSLLAPDAVRALIELIASLWDLDEKAEITLEANPDDLEKFAGLSLAGVNRLSLGVQSLGDESLRFLGRNHSSGLARLAVKEGRKCFASVSLDFIYALPNQTVDDWRNELSEIVTLGADHLSLYELTIEQRTAFGKAVERGAWIPADENVAANLYELTQEMMHQAGYPAYEISNHAISPIHEAKHNIIYWRSGDWLGVGPGAHGRVTIGGKRFETIAELRPEQYIARVNETGLGLASENELTIDDVANERVMMGLRMVAGMPRSDFEDLVKRPFDQKLLEDLVSDRLVQVDAANIALKADGRLLADHISSKLVLT